MNRPSMDRRAFLAGAVSAAGLGFGADEATAAMATEAGSLPRRWCWRKQPIHIKENHA